MIEVQENDRYVNGIIYKALILLLFELVIVLLFFENKLSLALGLVIGGGLSIVSFRVIYLNILIAIGKSEEKAKKYMTISYTIRYIVYGLVLAFSALSSLFSIYTCALGLFSIKLAMYINNWITLFYNRKEGSNGN